MILTTSLICVGVLVVFMLFGTAVLNFFGAAPAQDDASATLSYAVVPIRIPLTVRPRSAPIRWAQVKPLNASALRPWLVKPESPTQSRRFSAVRLSGSAVRALLLADHQQGVAIELLQTVPKVQQEMGAAVLRLVFTQQSATAVEKHAQGQVCRCGHLPQRRCDPTGSR